ncbi:uncharacterized protein LOC119484016 [Sebastes umbrosus]|uniref:uncharacterized protein LOC119484016 n=1 Tax=Sebastes umbrosus TaxID=72105 RepID=UPI00189EFD90|nr:uncharacterized protein LOC119484016 [Sebastes umbrosus]
MMTSKIALTVALAAGLLLLSVTDARPADSTDAESTGAQEDAGMSIDGLFQGLKQFLNETLTFPKIDSDELQANENKVKADIKESDDVIMEMEAESEKEMKAYEKILDEAETAFVDQLKSTTEPDFKTLEEIEGKMIDEIGNEIKSEEKIEEEVYNYKKPEIESEENALSEILDDDESKIEAEIKSEMEAESKIEAEIKSEMEAERKEEEAVSN